MQKEITSGRSANDHLVEELSFLRKIFHQLILGHPNKIITLPNFQLVRCNHLRLEKELLLDREEKDVIVSIHIGLLSLSAQASVKQKICKNQP